MIIECRGKTVNLPDFFIVGAARSATASLWQYLTQHPDVFMPLNKEPSYFCELSNPGLAEFAHFDAYLQLFAEAGDAKAVGEASVSYLWAPESAPLIRGVFPDAKITTRNVKRELDMPWAALTYEMKGKTYSVQHMNHPGNPKGTKYSAYRNYGRFGAFTKAKIEKGQTLTLREIYLRGPSLSIVGSGTMIMESEKLDLTFLTGPPGQMPRIMSPPGELLEGIVREIAEIRVTGTLSDPKMQTVALKSLDEALRKLVRPSD